MSTGEMRFHLSCPIINILVCPVRPVNLMVYDRAGTTVQYLHTFGHPSHFEFLHRLECISVFNMTYKDKRTNIWVRERTIVIDIIRHVGETKWSWIEQIKRLNDERCTSRVTTWRPYDKERRQGRPAKR